MGEIYNCKISNILFEKIVSAKIINGTDTLQNIQPLINYENDNELFIGEEIIVLRVKRFGSDKYFYLRKKFFIPFLDTDNKIKFGNQIIQAIEEDDLLKLTSNDSYIEIIHKTLDQGHKKLDAQGAPATFQTEPVQFLATAELANGLGDDATIVPLTLEADKNYKHKLLELKTYDFNNEEVERFYSLINDFKYDVAKPAENYVEMGTLIKT